MKIRQFLSSSPADYLSRYTIVFFKYKQQYPLLFFSFLIQRLKNDVDHVVCVDIENMTDITALQAQFETACLGKKRIFWLGNITDIPQRTKKWLLQYSLQYTGPNILACAIEESSFVSHDAYEIIELPGFVPRSLFNVMWNFFAHHQQVDHRKVDMLYAYVESILLEDACLLLKYIELVGRNLKQFFDQWLELILVPQHSMFCLSQYLFARNASHFADYWQQLRFKYSEQFWISYWSDQFWRAAWYCYYMRSQKISLAKRIAYRLPFSFLQKDYRKHATKDLIRAHKNMYKLDYALKNGGNAIGLDVYLSQILIKKYAL